MPINPAEKNQAQLVFGDIEFGAQGRGGIGNRQDIKAIKYDDQSA
jgi:hypothetical protein